MDEFYDLSPVPIRRALGGMAVNHLMNPRSRLTDVERAHLIFNNSAGVQERVCKSFLKMPRDIRDVLCERMYELDEVAQDEIYDKLRPFAMWGLLDDEYFKDTPNVKYCLEEIIEGFADLAADLLENK